MPATLFILNDAPYGNERPYNALRLAGALGGARRSTLTQLADWTVAADKVLIY